MMKSFFKKLSLVMALAMVVSMMAPAASAFAADLVIAEQTEAKADAKAEYSVEVGKEVDFKFYGANAGWQDLYKWESSDETVAKTLVNEEGVQEGKFQGVKDGEVTITLTIGEQKATVKLVVGKGVVVDDKSFEVRQTTSNTVEITFADAKSATKDIAVTKLGKTTSGEVTEIVWPVNKVELKDNVATVTTWVDFGTGSYRFTANGVSEDKDTAVGYPDFAVIVYKNAYSYSEGGAITPEITVYDANGVKLNGYNNWYFELKNKDANAYVENASGLLYLWAVGAEAKIEATLSYVVGTQTKTVPCYVEVTCAAKPEYTVNGYLEKYAVTNATATDKIVWGKTDVIIDNGSYYVAGILKDSDDKTKSINDVADDTNNGLLDASKYYVKYETSNPTVALVHENTGEVIGVNVGKAYALVTLYKVNASDRTKDSKVGVIAAVPVDVCAAKKADSLVFDKYGATLLTSGDFTTVEVTTTTKDQYREDLADTVKSVYVKHNDVTYSNENGYVTINGNKFTIDASKFADVNANSLTFTVETNKGVKNNFVLTFKKVPGNGLVNKEFALNVKGAEIGTDATKLTASVEVVSAWAGSNLDKTPFYWGKPATCKENDLYVTVTGPDGKDLTSTTTATEMALAFKAIDTTSTATTGAIKAMAQGTYVVKLNLVTQTATGSDGKQIVNTKECDTKTFEIKYNLAAVKDVKIKNNKYTTTNVIWTDNVEFKVGDVAWNGTNFALGTVNKRELNGSVYVYDFTVKVPYGTAGAYYEVKIPVNQLFTK